MRLKDWEIKGIVEGIESTFRENGLPIEKSGLYLFGSRTRDDLKGGDIDLLLRTSQVILEHAKSLKFKFSVSIQNRIGEQKIDLLIIGQEPPIEPFAQIALEQAQLMKQW
ncbi:MAG: nucleotidyltransferase domain-containing protein [Deltaproteobacteria bacterium]|nr:nucleotidyltransferase domain-containing protein [Deltaproteobacteria bacterium]MBI3016412.1 nucleotidyltransferase domain-containing protein [Deltaproteobacteria bacterium]